MSSPYTELAARLRTIVSDMNTADIAALVEQTDFIESIKSFLQKHDFQRLQTLNQRLQQYSIIDLAELNETILEEWASTQTLEMPALVPPSPNTFSYSGMSDISSTPTQVPSALSTNMGGDNDWNFSGENDMLDDPNLSSIAVPSSSMANGTYSFGSDLSQQLPLPGPAHVKQALLPHHLESISSADRNSTRDTALLELLGDFSRDAKAGLPQVKAEEVLLAAKSLIRDDLQQFLNTFLEIWRTQGLWGDTNVELLMDSGTSHERLESAYRCLTRLGLRMADDPVRSRMASIVLHREFNAACAMLKAKTPSQQSTGVSGHRGRGLATPVIDSTLKRIHEDFERLPSIRQKELRAEFHDNKRFGKRWERLASSLGYGILIACSKSVNAVIKKTTFTDAMLDGLAYTVKNHMHDCENLITELDELAISLLSCKPLKTTTINVPRIEEKISIYRNSVSRTGSIPEIAGRQ